MPRIVKELNVEYAGTFCSIDNDIDWMQIVQAAYTDREGKQRQNKSVAIDSRDGLIDLRDMLLEAYPLTK